MQSINSSGAPVNQSRTKPCKRRRRKISLARWASISAAINWERFFLEVLEPDSPRIKISLPVVRWLKREPSTAVTSEMGEAA